MTLDADYRSRLAVWSDIQDHLEYLHDAAAGYAKPAVIELGVRSGNSTAALLAGCEKSGGHLWSCDIVPPLVFPQRDGVPEIWAGAPWTFLLGDSVSREVLRQMPAECDVLFVDTSHSFEQTIAELGAYMPRVRPGGIALFHDVRWEWPDISLPEVGGPVARALTAWCQVNGMEWSARHGAADGYGLGYIQP
jgi:predicted O-methyltransferase YrrM